MEELEPRVKMPFVAPAFTAPLLSLAGVVAKSLSLVTESCYVTIFEQREIFDAVCLKALLAKAIGWVMTLAAAVVKTPQIRNMVKGQTASGLAPISIYIETFMYSCSVAYFVLKDLGDDGQLNRCITRELCLKIVGSAFRAARGQCVMAPPQTPETYPNFQLGVLV